MGKSKLQNGQIVGDNIEFLQYLDHDAKGQLMGEFKCHCGNIFKAPTKRVTGFEKKNCGCGVTIRSNRPLYKKETPEYSSWNSMKARCNNTNSKDYHRYGAKGITICPEWNDPKTGFSKFLEDMGPRPAPGYTIDRRDGTKGYSKENCRWATYIEQNRNLSSNRTITYKGKTMIRIEWINFIGINESTFDNYLIRHGNNMENILKEMKSKGLQLNYP